MISYLKSKFLEHPEKLVEYLEHFGYCHVKNHGSYISFARDDNKDSSPTGISLYLSENLICKDYSRVITLDVFNLIIKSRNISFKEAITTAKDILGIERGWYPERSSNKAFGGFYTSIKQNRSAVLKVYDDCVLDGYKKCGNLRFLQDGISLDTQRYFNIGFDVESQSITIPIYSDIGELVGVKARINKDPDENEQKYFYLIPVGMSNTLYGYSQNYEYLESSDIVYVTESEKGCMQAFTNGYKSFVALGSGSISKKQVQMLLSLNCKTVVFLHDVGFKMESIQRNLEMIRCYSRFKEIKLGYWDYFDKEYEDKISATDLGEDKLSYILENEIKYI